MQAVYVDYEGIDGNTKRQIDSSSPK